MARRRSAGRPTTLTKTIGDLRVTSNRSCSAKEETRHYKFKISAAPPCCSPDTRPARESVYPENNRGVMPKHRLGPERTMETNPSTHPRTVQKMWTIRNRNARRYAKICIPPKISLSDGRRLTGLHQSTTTDKRKRGDLYLGCR